MVFLVGAECAGRYAARRSCQGPHGVLRRLPRLPPPASKYLSVRTAPLTGLPAAALVEPAGATREFQGQAGPGWEKQRAFVAALGAAGAPNRARALPSPRLLPPHPRARLRPGTASPGKPASGLPLPQRQARKTFPTQTPFLKLWGNQAALVRFFI